MAPKSVPGHHGRPIYTGSRVIVAKVDPSSALHNLDIGQKGRVKALEDSLNEKGRPCLIVQWDDPDMDARNPSGRFAHQFLPIDCTEPERRGGSS